MGSQEVMVALVELVLLMGLVELVIMMMEMEVMGVREVMEDQEVMVQMVCLRLCDWSVEML